MSKELKFLPNPFFPGNHPHCDDVERGLCHVIENGEYVFKEKFDKQYLDEYDKIFGGSTETP